MTRIPTLVAALWLGMTPVLAGADPVVVELFTAQGCSSCPPADAMMHELVDRDDVIVLALHVDYWDYIGWKDPFAHPEHAKRQRAYAVHAGRRSVYTPEMVVDGTTDIVGAKPMALNKALMEHAGQAETVSLGLLRDASAVQITAQSLVAPQAMEVHVAQYQPARTTKITRGENAGKTLTYANVVQDWRMVGTWNGEAPLSIRVDVDATLPVVVLIQKAGPGAILAAARLR